ncbi:dolichol-phosphate mannosyltransferase [Geoalkalibacter ferrihydriticus]|uniref:Dolichol-phosphate mannosyltransferase n=1 Tax=Geoalkalibacter ferrihydriticus TaxID=392333 RepID=A0A1G9WNT1_9BACT|nr:glycosyltransferase family 2 protein [Geoalkalibacter ferrihydriticus]SDM86224.1 dolichol-phosphate mannosyltransferase [Geoalkalibacter ferrihydriticus]
MDIQRGLTSPSHLSDNAGNENPVLSVVVPAFNEEGNLRKLCDELFSVLLPLGLSWEIILVDDGSTDATWAAIENLHREDRRVRGIRLSRNFGHQNALLAGLHYAGGEAVISMDADLQHPPDLIPDMVTAWQKGARIVHTLRRDSQELPFFKKWSSRLYYRIFSFFTGVKLAQGMADFRLLDRQVLQHILQMPEENPFLRGIVQWVGFPSVSLAFNSRKRHSGQTKYTLRKMLKFAWQGISSFSLVPLRIAVVLGFATSGFAFAGIVYAIYSKLIAGETVSGWASTIAIVSFLFGVLFILLGVLGEYLGRILMEVRKRPQYLVSETTTGGALRTTDTAEPVPFSDRKSSHGES